MTTTPNDTLPLEFQLVDAMRDGLAVFDPAGNLLRWNSSARSRDGRRGGRAARDRRAAARRHRGPRGQVGPMPVIYGWKLAGGGCYRTARLVQTQGP